MPTQDDASHQHERYSPPGFVPLEVRPPGAGTPPAAEAGGVHHDHRGALRIYLGAAPGVGKTYAMLREAHRLREEGRDVVVGFVETHGRAETAAQVGDLEVVPRTAIDYRGVRVEEMDTDAILARKPEIAIVDELAHTNAPGSPREKRWEDVEVLRDAGVDVISALNVQHIASLQDLVADMTGVNVRETVPDRVVAGATELQLVDLPVEALLDRIALGKVYPPATAQRARERFFQPGTLNALRELALRRTAEGVDDRLTGMMLGTPSAEQHVATPPTPAERIVVLLDATPAWGEILRRGWRLASALHGELIVVDIVADEEDRDVSAQRQRSRDLAHDLGARIETVRLESSADDATMRALATLRATNLVLGINPAPTRRRWFGGDTDADFDLAKSILRTMPGITIELVSRS
ncbi:MAG TPA: hypothetical protein VNP95_07415 [Thermomicrobiales bacterium]|nr:hypothetical protein [Thermomicrobiales bacterium]